MNILEPKYIAGFFDGEGSVGIYYSKKKNFYHLLVTFTNTYCPILKNLKESFGGCVYSDKRNFRNTNLIVHQWRIEHKKALYFLKEIYPYLIIKKEQARIAIKFQSTRRRSTQIKDKNLKFELNEARKIGVSEWNKL